MSPLRGVVFTTCQHHVAVLRYLLETVSNGLGVRSNANGSSKDRGEGISHILWFFRNINIYCLRTASSSLKTLVSTVCIQCFPFMVALISRASIRSLVTGLEYWTALFHELPLERDMVATIACSGIVPLCINYESDPSPIV